MSDEFLIPPPNSMTVDHARRAVLYTADGRALMRCAGFKPQGVNMQTTGTNPPLSDNTNRKPTKKGKR